MNEIMNISGVECYEKNGIAYLELETVARGLGFTQIAASGNEVVRWERVRRYLSELGIPTCGDGDFIPENIFYRLAMKAKNETAERFQALVADEIIPSIRKHGMYATAETVEQMLADPDVTIRLLTEIKNEREQRARLEEENALLVPDANMARDLMKFDGLHTLKEVADLVEKGRTELCTLLRAENVLSKQTGYNLPLNKYLKQGYFKAKIAEGSKRPVTLVTARGLRFIYRLIKKYDLVDDFDTQALLDAATEMESVA